MSEGTAVAPAKRSLRLERPLVFFDIETTGTTIGADRIVELAAVKVWPDGVRKSYVWRVNPERPIPPEASKIHGITDEDVKDKPTLQQLLAEIRELFTGSDVAGFNVARFDVPMLQSEIARVGARFDVCQRHIVDAMAIYHIQEPRNLTAAYRHYCNKELENAHSALADVNATVEILESQVASYSDLPTSVEELAAFGGRSDEKYADSGRWFAFKDESFFFAKGKYKGQSLSTVARENGDYLEWMCSNAELPADTLKYVQEALRTTKSPNG